ncbi:carboxymuconolactone decarboxylase family protein [Micromonospora sp. ALFpr18c]|uniref:carboxymuconolactone decarboxylase family protein n=1 Tax=Micromonospora sp. ALFpr18c TaxID=1458665 RepID=UPI00124BA184|nr:carboxymuconolactone decarboxylase family protein [Micromonospora sp. ALFpr18c]KAB1947315.1 carboxymuconolactone decarboxylase family protein [Micromonospora sp. ALFpr18c]
MTGLYARVARRPSRGHVRRVTPVRVERADGLVAAVYQQVERDFGMLAPPVSLHSPAPQVLAACWVTLRETLVAAGRLDRATRETVAAAVSAANSCPYCVEVHSATLAGLVRPASDAPADTRLARVADWARAATDRTSARHAVPPVARDEAVELLGVALVFQYLNRMVNIFLEPSPIPAGVPEPIRGGVRRTFGRLMARGARGDRPAGAALELLPSAPPAPDLAWAAGNPILADALARGAAAVDAAGRRSVPESVRDLVASRLDAWDGRPTGLSRAWVGDAVGDLPAADRPAGRLALLTAFAAYQVDDEVVAAVRAGGADDRALIELTAWASMAAARRAAAWVPLDPVVPPRPS